jgi:DNA polymerase V
MDVALKFYSRDNIEEELYISYSEALVKAGFPSPAQDHTDLKLDLNRELVKNPSSTFFARVSGTSMVDDGVDDGDLLVIDKSLSPEEGSLAVCYLDGEFTLKRIALKADHLLLVPANPEYNPIKVTADNEFLIWGIVRYIIKKV